MRRIVVKVDGPHAYSPPLILEPLTLLHHTHVKPWLGAPISVVPLSLKCPACSVRSLVDHNLSPTLFFIARIVILVLRIPRSLSSIPPRLTRLGTDR